MMRWILGVAIAALLGALLLGGTAPFGRVALAAGLPRLAAVFFNDPAWAGIAHYRAGDWEKAETAFREARAFHNLGNARTQNGDYAAALEAFDVARSQGDADATANFDLVAAFYAGLALDPETPIAWFTEKEDTVQAQAPVGKGNGRAAGTGSESTNTGALLGLPELESRGPLGMRRVFDEKFMVADRRWLAQLEDVPGEFLKERISFEHKRRDKLGMSPPDPEDPR